MKNLVNVYDLTKEYNLKNQKKKLLALNKINFSIKEGEIFGLLGPNGAGKTTIIQILTTLLQPTSGYATIDGFNILNNPREIKERTALMLDRLILYNRLTAYSNLKFFCKMYNISNYKEKINQIAKDFDMLKWMDQYVENFSSGMAMKLALCRTLLLERKFIILDEPTKGLDLKNKSFIIDKIKNLNKTVLLTSHDMSVVEKLCNRIAFISKGHIIKIGDKEDIKRAEQKEIKVEIQLAQDLDLLKQELLKENFTVDLFQKNDNTIVISLSKRTSYKELMNVLSNYSLLKIKELELSLEDLFLNFI